MNLDTLTTDQADRIIGAGIELMGAFADAFGADEGIRIWEIMSEEVGPEFRGAIFMAILAGRQSGVIVIQPSPTVRSSGKFVEYIKYIRHYTGFGLKEAKDIAAATEGGKPQTITVKFSERGKCVSDLRKLGVNCS